MLQLTPRTQLVLILQPLGGMSEGRAVINWSADARAEVEGRVWIDPESLAETEPERRQAIERLLTIGAEAARDAMRNELGV